MDSISDQAGALTLIIIETRGTLGHINNQMDRLSQMKAQKIHELNAAKKALSVLIGDPQ